MVIIFYWYVINPERLNFSFMTSFSHTLDLVAGKHSQGVELIKNLEHAKLNLVTSGFFFL